MAQIIKIARVCVSVSLSVCLSVSSPTVTILTHTYIHKSFIKTMKISFDENLHPLHLLILEPHCLVPMLLF